jgi:hypothetical protein
MKISNSGHGVPREKNDEKRPVGTFPHRVKKEWLRCLNDKKGATTRQGGCPDGKKKCLAGRERRATGARQSDEKRFNGGRGRP